MNSKNHNNRVVRFESLEDRKLMAGNITADVINDELVLNGDGSANAVEVHQTALNIYKVTGLNGTKINGKDDKSFIVKKGILVDLKGGDDSFEMGGTVFVDDVDGRLKIEMGAGKDKVTLGRVRVDGDTTINTSTEDDTVFLGFASLGKLTVNTGAGHDTFSTGFSASGQTVVNMEAGNDKFVGSSFWDSLKVDSGIGDDTIELFLATAEGNIDLLAGANNDTVKLQAVIASGVTVDTAAGVDQVILQGGLKTNSSSIKTGSENDTVEFKGATMQTALTVDTADGLDSIVATDTTFEKALTLKTGLGNDVVELNRVTALRSVNIDTDKGDDTVTLIDVAANGQRIDINTRDGEDKVSLTRVVADQLFAKLGNGRDEIRVRDSKFRVTNLDGEADLDKFFDLLGNDFGTLTLTSF